MTRPINQLNCDKSGSGGSSAYNEDFEYYERSKKYLHYAESIAL